MNMDAEIILVTLVKPLLKKGMYIESFSFFISEMDIRDPVKFGEVSME